MQIPSLPGAQLSDRVFINPKPQFPCLNYGRSNCTHCGHFGVSDGAWRTADIVMFLMVLFSFIHCFHKFVLRLHYVQDAGAPYGCE